jgi:glutamate/tyrosine decarboxylase-like PLP-dependent enzyme
MSDRSIQERMFEELTDKRVFEQAKAFAFDYMDCVAERSVFPEQGAIDGLRVFDEPMPNDPSPSGEVIAALHDFGSPATVAQTGGRYFGFVSGNVVPAALAASWLAGAWDQNAALDVMSPIAAKLESVCEGWLVDLLGLPEGTAAGLVSGTSVATFCGLAAARYSILSKLDWDVNAKGLRGAPRIRFVASDQSHGSVFKALALLGIGRNEVEIVPSDSQGRIDPAHLPAIDDRTLLVLQAGNVNTGAFDAFSSICSGVREAGGWVHVDGAFGLWAAASPGLKYLTDGVEFADSWSVDGHKTLNTPYDCGVILCRDRRSLVTSMQATGSYIQLSDQRDGMFYGTDMSRRARSIELWATLKYLGRSGVAELVDGLCERASQFATELAERGFRILNEVVFNQLLVASETPEETEAILIQLQKGGVLWCGGTSWKNEAAIRISICSWATTENDVRECVAAFVEARVRVRAAGRIGGSCIGSTIG